MILIIIRQSDSKRDPSAVFYNHKSNKASMRNKTQTRSNADTEDGDEDDRDLALPSHPSHSLIRDVWAHNFDEELQRIATLADEYPVIALVHLRPFRILNFPGIWSPSTHLVSITAQSNLTTSSFGTMSSKQNSSRSDLHSPHLMEL